MSTQQQKVKVKELPIRLGQFLKLANLVQDGIEAKMRIQDGEVMVNGTTEVRRGKQLKPLDEITIDGGTWIVDLEL
ncbi:MAG: RNA-binding S4 domain-containing protein [Desulfobulbaceae bacterium]|nr:RNA-binding S4 domain-containing protein [Desulfobulbaceae bacterium]